jgi:hypothetical protein
LLCEEGLKPRLGLLVSTGFLLFLKVIFACFADSGIMLFQEILYTAHANLNILVTSWTLNNSVIDRKLVGSPDKYVSLIILSVSCLLTTAFASLTWSPGLGRRSGRQAMMF